jgi:L-ascorbate metabolism protein UlaG (beta-lactamase superfamily)
MRLRITHIGGPTTLIELDGWRILTDPTFDAPGRRYDFGWRTSSTKLVGPAVGVDQVGRIDAVLLTHDHHADNLDTAGRTLLATVPSIVTTRSGAARLGSPANGLAPWQTIRLEAAGRPAMHVTATPCRHGPPLSRPIVGEVAGFALASEDNGDRVCWISGDTVLFRGLHEVPRRLDVDVALLHLGGVRFPVTGPLRYTMTARQAVRFVRELAPRLAIPVHYEGWSHFKQHRSAIEARIARAPADVSARFRFVAIGEPFDTEGAVVT